MEPNDLADNTFDNVFYDHFDYVRSHYAGLTEMQVWEAKKIISLRGTGNDIGLFNKSDIIIVYDKDTGLPVIVTERIYKRNYTPRSYRKIVRYLKHKSRVIEYELGFHIKLSFTLDYVDYIHYKEEWWEWARKSN